MYREASSSRTWNVPAKMERPHLDSLSLYVRALQHAKVIDDNLQLSETLPKDVHEAYQQWARSIDPYIQGQSQEDTHKQKPNIEIIELTRVEMAGRNTEYEDGRRRRLEQFEIDTVLRSGLRRQLLDPGGLFIVTRTRLRRRLGCPAAFLILRSLTSQTPMTLRGPSMKALMPSRIYPRPPPQGQTPRTIALTWRTLR